MIICRPPIKPSNRHLQTFLASSRWRLRRLKLSNPVVNNQVEQVFENPYGTLQGWYTENDSDDLVILFHGWEGSAQSTYIQLLADSLYQAGFSVFRLNFRDHGNSHHLNENLFHSCRLDEVLCTVGMIQEKISHKRLYLCGFSLGGNFALRVAANADKHKIKLNQLFSVSPPLSPKNSMSAISGSWLYSKYFLRKWKRSLLIKQKLYPKLFKSANWQNLSSLAKMTELLIREHTEFQSTDDYFNAYSIDKKMIESISCPTHILTSMDDPVIPFDDFTKIDRSPVLKINASTTGGHCGFVMGRSMRSWVEDYIINEINNEPI